MRAEQDRQLARMANDHELALKHQRVEFYRSALHGGGNDVLILHLIEHPQDVQAVVKLVNEGHIGQFQQAMDLARSLVEHRRINAADAEPMFAHAMDKMRSAAGNSIATTTVAVTDEHSIKTTEETKRRRAEVKLT